MGCWVEEEGREEGEIGELDWLSLKRLIDPWRTFSLSITTLFSCVMGGLVHSAPKPLSIGGFQLS